MTKIKQWNYFRLSKILKNSAWFKRGKNNIYRMQSNKQLDFKIFVRKEYSRYFWYYRLYINNKYIPGCNLLARRIWKKHHKINRIVERY